ncbi:hypothetical protein KFE19_10740 [Dysosmobacter sp. Marseille-Q4140]|nr:hypothetical protein KFE19_10740 [Dysosmobacter sp. Marseille-Q4140]
MTKTMIKKSLRAYISSCDSKKSISGRRSKSERKKEKTLGISVIPRVWWRLLDSNQ